ncbi:hypothetical protein COV24_04450 [candidate division WWE3 bacterium CG10_big_fil_rev_8_21_14_0_10_32_10]|uniref:Uncharacterized protein n=1 Tax=candidate division WWE3 bacterium CG10_big_fil_rev_8_21_14_0_10_32_10 TaxID=1975090 RepID=A0A2H0R9C2_UNCKA|nr:MAG: hypothetical protein COV24_04450 [candidate division WWE3 bacterium CG10_big_fil_rev_8_21_14_0_10_32_10]
MARSKKHSLSHVPLLSHRVSIAFIPHIVTAVTLSYMISLLVFIFGMYSGLSYATYYARTEPVAFYPVNYNNSAEMEIMVQNVLDETAINEHLNSIDETLNNANLVALNETMYQGDSAFLNRNTNRTYLDPRSGQKGFSGSVPLTIAQIINLRLNNNYWMQVAGVVLLLGAIVAAFNYLEDKHYERKNTKTHKKVTSKKASKKKSAKSSRKRA